MPANTPHPAYGKFHDFWCRVRDCVAGEDAVKSRGAKYLPMLNEQETKEYDDYKLRATFYEATGRTVDGLQGAIMRKPADVEFPAGDKKRLESVGVAGESFAHMSGVTVRECTIAGRLGLLVDSSEDEKAEYPAYVSIYPAEDILNWRQEMVKGKKVVTMVVLAEKYQEPDPKDPFVLIDRPQWRCLHLGTGPSIEYGGGRPRFNPKFSEAERSTPFYYQDVWRENPNKQAQEKLILFKTIVPRKKGGRLWNEIPFAFANASDNDPDPKEPPLLGLANVNLSHYRTSADLEHGRHFTALPTAYFAGFSFDGEVRLGSTVAYSTDTPGASAGFLEFTGQGLKSLETAQEQKEKQMATLGSRMLESQKAGVETAASIQLRSSGEQSALTLIAKSCSAAWTCALRWMHAWGQASDEASSKITVALNTEFTVVTLGAQELSSLVQTVQGGLMSWPTFFYNLQRGGLIPADVTEADEREEIETNGVPAALGLTLTGPTPPQDAQPPDAQPTDGHQPPEPKGAATAAD